MEINYKTSVARNKNSECDLEALDRLHTSETRPQPTQDTSGDVLSQVLLTVYRRGEARGVL